MTSIDQIFAGFLDYERTYPEYAKKTLEHYRSHARLAALASFAPKPRAPRSATYVFAGNISYFSDVLSLCADEEAAILTTGVRTHLKALKAGRNSHFVINLYHGLYEYLSNPFSAKRKIRYNIDMLSCLLEKMGPTFLFVQSDTMPFERAIIAAAREADIRTVCLQHGLFTRETPRNLTEGKFADIFLAYDDAQAKIVQEGSPSCRVLISGSLKQNSPKLPRVQDPSVVFLGQPYPLLLNEAKAPAYFDLVRDISDHCRNAGVRLWYKPHPGELGSTYLEKFPDRLFGSIETIFGQYQYFLGVSSTALHQASIRGKTAVQILDPTLHTERYSDLGYCYSYDRQDVAMLLADIGELAPYSSNSLNAFESGDLVGRWDRVKTQLACIADQAAAKILEAG